jgi:transposase-like protein
VRSSCWRCVGTTRYGLSYRDGEELLAERDIAVDHVSVFGWVHRFTALLIDAARPCRHAPGDRWFVDETCITIAGRWVSLYRAIGQDGQVIDVLISQKRPTGQSAPGRSWSGTLTRCGAVATVVLPDGRPIAVTRPRTAEHAYRRHRQHGT